MYIFNDILNYRVVFEKSVLSSNLPVWFYFVIILCFSILVLLLCISITCCLSSWIDSFRIMSSCYVLLCWIHDLLTFRPCPHLFRKYINQDISISPCYVTNFCSWQYYSYTPKLKLLLNSEAQVGFLSFLVKFNIVNSQLFGYTYLEVFLSNLHLI